jgi:hypothetical protein
MACEEAVQARAREFVLGRAGEMCAQVCSVYCWTKRIRTNAERFISKVCAAQSGCGPSNLIRGIPLQDFNSTPAPRKVPTVCKFIPSRKKSWYDFRLNSIRQVLRGDVRRRRFWRRYKFLLNQIKRGDALKLIQLDESETKSEP